MFVHEPYRLNDSNNNHSGKTDDDDAASSDGSIRVDEDPSDDSDADYATAARALRHGHAGMTIHDDDPKTRFQPHFLSSTTNQRRRTASGSPPSGGHMMT